MLLCDIAGDFAGGFVQLNALIMEAAPGAGQWIALTAYLDGVQVSSRTNWMANGASNVAVALSQTIRVSPGRHRISISATSSAAAGAWGGNGALLDVAEL